MKILAKINEDNSFGGNYYEEYVKDEYTYTENYYNKNFVKPQWNGSDWIEGATPEEIQEQENQQKQELKKQAYEELLPTDWYVVRFIETGIAIPQEILDQRQAIRNKYESI